jgi:hypothetical protein
MIGHQDELTRVRVRQDKGVMFELAAEDQPIKPPIAILFGAVPNPTEYRFAVQVSERQVKELTATPLEDARTGMGDAQILPTDG